MSARTADAVSGSTGVEACAPGDALRAGADGAAGLPELAPEQAVNASPAATAAGTIPIA
ncbi:MAG TPA: hypothetical protein VHT94_01475 [Streptosporangiaceae bacterium]|nr:hypothetical protein [Streptosporangiaceae bacterium]